MLAIRGLLGGFTKRLEKYESLLLAMPFPPRDAIREHHILNSFQPRSIALGLERHTWRNGELPVDMQFDQVQLQSLKDDIMASEGVRPVLTEEEGPPQPLEDYYQEAEWIVERSAKEDKVMDGKKILEEKDGVVKLSCASYHFKVMKLLAAKNLFGRRFNPYKKSYQKVVYSAIAKSHADEMVEKITHFLQESHSAYEAIFVAGKRSVFGPADVEGDASQHLAQLVHFFKSKISSQPLLK